MGKAMTQNLVQTYLASPYIATNALTCYVLVCFAGKICHSKLSQL